ncbi:MAG TPA: hypothetical protein DD723_06505 [Candidatus Omnitrophica bacterium]|nr:hypothetical protein [Candidatus Omnitrophota bacterium]
MKGSEKSSDKIFAVSRKNGSISATQLARILGVSPRAIKKQIANLRSFGVLKHVGGRKMGQWEIIDKNNLSVPGP